MITLDINNNSTPHNPLTPLIANAMPMSFGYDMERSLAGSREEEALAARALSGNIEAIVA